jgi:hypothetical protein
MKRDRYGHILFIEDTPEYLVFPSLFKEQLKKEETLLFETWPEQLGMGKKNSKAPTLEEWKKTKPKTPEKMRRLYRSQLHLLDLQLLYSGRKMLRHMERHNDFLESVLAPPTSKNSPSVETKVECYIKAVVGVDDKKKKKKRSSKKTKERVYATTDEWLTSGKKKK